MKKCGLAAEFLTPLVRSARVRNGTWPKSRLQWPSGHNKKHLQFRFETTSKVEETKMTVEMSRRAFCGTVAGSILLHCGRGSSLLAEGDTKLRGQALAALRKAVEYYRSQVASHGGYVYHYSLDLQKRWGEGVATKDQIWVQPPGTPTVGLAYVAAYQATGDAFYLDAVTETAKALIYGQLKSGGWTNSVDFAPDGKLVSLYRNGKGRGRNNSTFDDGISQSALQFLMRADQVHRFQHKEIHEAVSIGMDAVLRAQFPNGGFPQVWTGPVTPQPVVRAVYPDYDWKTENRIKNYWDLYTLNDDTTAFIADMLIMAFEIYQDDRYPQALKRLGEFLILAQMPDPQPAWAQQYDYQMRPVWARKFEPPAVAGRESQGAMETLMKIYQQTNDARFLEPIPRAVAYLQKSLLKDGRLARYYELQTNTPLYMTEAYELTHDDSQVPQHYGWKNDSHLDRIEKKYAELKAGKKTSAKVQSGTQLEKQVRQIIGELDAQGRWISKSAGESLVGQPKIRPNELYLSSAVFSKNVEALSAYLSATR